MSLLCDEVGRDIEFGEPLYAGTRQDVPFASALCQEVISRIPESSRRPECCVSGEGGVDIHKGTSSRNFNGSYSLCAFACDEFLFSVSQATAEQYLPKHIKRYKRGTD